MKKLTSFMLLLGIASVALIFINSCSTAIMKTSPFYTGKMIVGKTSSGNVVRWDNPDAVKVEKIWANEITAKMDDNRAYIWPLFYKNFFIYSILWPLIEFNDIGWKVRPFVSVDNYNKDYSILSGGWNSKENSNYILPFYVKNKTSFFSLPYSKGKKGNDWIYNYFLFAGYFSNDNSSYLFPLYYYNGNKKTVYTPICSFSKQSGYILPFYFYNQDSDTRKDYILPPFGFSSYNKEKSYLKENYFFPLYSYKNSSIRNYYKNPKYKGQKFSSNNKPNDYTLKYKSMEKRLFILPSIYFKNNEKKQIKKQVIFPFYFYGYNNYKHSNQNNGWFHLFPVYFSEYKFGKTWNNKPINKKYKTIVPFYSAGYKKYGNIDKEWNYILPFYIYKRNKKDTFQSYMIIAGNETKYLDDKKYDSSFFIPFYLHNYSKASFSRSNPKYKNKDISYDDRPKDYFIKSKTICKKSFYFPWIFKDEYQDNLESHFEFFPFFSKGFNKHNENDLEWVSSPFIYSYFRDKKYIHRNYAVLAGTEEKVLFDKKYNSSYFIPFYSNAYEKNIDYLDNPKYKDKSFTDTKEPSDLYIKDKSIIKTQYIFPSIFFEQYDNNKYSSTTVFPFFFKGWNKRYDWDSEWFTLFPCYSYFRDKKYIHKNYAVLAGTEEKSLFDKKYNSSYFIPFYSNNYKENIDTIRNPKYKNQYLENKKDPSDLYIEDKSIVKSQYYFPSIFFEKYENNKYSSSVVFPFWFEGCDKRYNRDSKWLTFFPFYSHKYKLQTSRNIAPKYKNKEISYKNRPKDYFIETSSIQKIAYYFPNIYTEENKKLGDFNLSLFPFYFYEKTKKYEKAGTPFSIFKSKKSFINDSKSFNLCWFLWDYNKNKYKITEYVFPSYYSYSNRKDNHTITNFFPFTFHEKTDDMDSFGTFLYLYTSRNNLKDKEIKRQFLWYLWYNKQILEDKATNQEYYESSRVLGEFYHRETKGNTTNINLFPFISYSKNEKRKKFSIAWRFFNIETHKNSTKIHLLFCPIWW